MADTGFDYDLFISYAHIDDQTITKDQEGWIAMLHRALDIRLAQLLGEKPKIWRDPKLSGNDYLNEEIIEELTRAIVLVSVLSPRYVKSEWCVKEIETFMKAAQQSIGLRLGNKCRIFKVIKTPIPREQHPPETRDLLGYEFYEIDSETGRPHEFMGFGGDPAPEYWEKLEDLAQDIRELLYILKIRQDGQPSPASSGVAVYLAETTYDLREERDQIRRELQTRGHIVLPDRPLPHYLPELEAVVRENLSRCTLSVHLIGERYGVVPEAADCCILELQNTLSIERSRQAPGFSRLIWLPDGLKPVDERQAAFIRDLQTDPVLQPGDDLLQCTLEDLKTAIQDKLEALKVTGETSAEPELTRIYLICDQRDLDAVEPMQDYLYEQKYEPLLPLFEGDEADVSEDHQENLRICDGVIIYHGHASEAWLRGKMRDLRKAPGYDRSKPIQAKAIYVAGPETPQKERLRTLEVDEIIRNFGDFSPDHLRPFLDRLQGKKGGRDDG